MTITPRTARSAAGLLACTVGALSIGLAAQKQASAPQQTRPTFKSGVDISRTTVRVLDSNHRPVRGLTQQDFTVLVNGEPQQIVTVVADDEAPPATPSAPWMRDIAPDVAANDLVDPRLVMIIMDDVTDMDIPLAKSKASPYQLTQAKLVTRAIIDELGPNDLASVVYTGDNRGPQDFTRDRAKLLAAVERYHVTEVKKWLSLEYRRNVIQLALEFLRQIPEHRSVILWVSDTFLPADENILPLEVRPAPGNSKTAESRQLGSASVPVYQISTQGFTGLEAAQDDDHTLSGRTGGRTIAQTNTPAVEVPEIFDELRVAYTIGFQQSHPESDGKFRRVEVRVNRPGVTILPAEIGYFPPSAKQIGKAGVATARGNPTTLALAGLIPLSDEPLRLSIAPFAATGKGDSELARVAVVLGVDLPFAGGGIGDTVDLEMRIFDAEGRKQIDERHSTQAIRPRGGRNRGEFDLLSTLSLKPGRYNVRASMRSALRESAGSVYADFVVPDFRKAAFSLSGLVLSSAPEKPSLPLGEFQQWLPVVPTTTRAFATTDRVSAFLRAYAGSNEVAGPITLQSEIRDDHDTVVLTKTDTLTPAGTGIKNAEYRMPLPLGTLRPGEYLLTIRGIVAPDLEIRRDVRFSVR